MRRLTLVIALLATACGVLLAPAGAVAKKRKSKSPQVTSVSPMRVKPGRSLSIRGRNFSSSRRRNTVIFAVGRRSIFVKPSRASSRRLVVKVPVSLERIMHQKDGGLTPTRFTIKVAAGRKFSRKTSRRLSPVIVPLSSAKITVPSAPPSGSNGGNGGTGGAGGSGFVPSDDCDNDGTPDSSDTNSDKDLLTDAQERSLKTDPCKADTDGDGAEDGFEYRSALDLNHFPRTPPYPYPGPRPYPNPLDPSDGNTDYDGDSLTVREEFLAWFRYSDDGVRRSGRPTGDITNPATPMLYSDGLQKSKDPAPAAPPGTLYAWALDQDENGELWDDERDADGDGLGNYDEQHGQFTEAWWPAQHDGQIEPKESKYPGIDFLDVEDLPQHDGLANPDMDGDQIVDGSDDHDHDGLTNQYEVRRPGDWLMDAWNGGAPSTPGANPWAYTNPFNPCKPFNSERCHAHPPFGYYESDEVPPIGPNPPANYTTVHPATPDG
jgi:IPT/TIG domain